jgi:hypothetical protein
VAGRDDQGEGVRRRDRVAGQATPGQRGRRTPGVQHPDERRPGDRSQRQGGADVEEKDKRARPDRRRHYDEAGCDRECSSSATQGPPGKLCRSPLERTRGRPRGALRLEGRGFVDDRDQTGVAIGSLLGHAARLGIAVRHDDEDLGRWVVAHQEPGERCFQLGLLGRRRHHHRERVGARLAPLGHASSVRARASAACNSSRRCFGRSS